MYLDAPTNKWFFFIIQLISVFVVKNMGYNLELGALLRASWQLKLLVNKKVIRLFQFCRVCGRCRKRHNSTQCHQILPQVWRVPQSSLCRDGAEWHRNYDEHLWLVWRSVSFLLDIFYFKYQKHNLSYFNFLKATVYIINTFLEI